ncbi:MAG: hypothetical protein M3O70_02120, partial [Actinomycetota bacterium]|nr:hypothetical protein [Actinomycetota bacterium]
MRRGLFVLPRRGVGGVSVRPRPDVTLLVHRELLVLTGRAAPSNVLSWSFSVSTSPLGGPCHLITR